MSYYIWSEYSKNTYYEVLTGKISHYFEQFEKKDNTAYVNIDFRFADIFFPEQNIENQEELFRKYLEDNNYKDFANLLLHYLAKLDLSRGLTLVDIVANIELKAIENNKYGENLKNNFNKLNSKHKEILTRYLAEYDLNNQKESYLNQVIFNSFKGVKIYYENFTQIMHFFIGESETLYNLNLLEIIKCLFKPIYLKMEIMWNTHFGITEGYYSRYEDTSNCIKYLEEVKIIDNIYSLKEYMIIDEVFIY